MGNGIYYKEAKEYFIEGKMEDKNEINIQIYGDLPCANYSAGKISFTQCTAEDISSFAKLPPIPKPSNPTSLKLRGVGPSIFIFIYIASHSSIYSCEFKLKLKSFDEGIIDFKEIKRRL